MTIRSYVLQTGLGVVILAICIGVSGVRAAEPMLDSDGDGIPDTWEMTVYHTDPLQSDTDHDGFTDRTEIVNGYNPLGAGPLTETDIDHDGLNDRLEVIFQTDPTNIDTNANGRQDGAELKAGWSPTSTTPVPLQKSLVISIKKAQLDMRINNVAIATFPMSAGLPRTPTPVGTFKVLQKNPRAWSSSAKLWMPYWMHFSGRGHGIHELPEWPNGRKEGESHLGHLASHGCIRLGVGAAKMVYDWSPVGTPVIITKL